MVGLYSSLGLINEAKLAENYDALAYYQRSEGYFESSVTISTHLKVNETDFL